MADMKDLIEYMAKSVVNDPEAVILTEKRGPRSAVYYLDVSGEDMGRVIGKDGRMANAMRILLRVAAVKAGKHVTLEIGQ